MKYLKFTYVDATTAISVASEPALSGTTFPAVVGLAFAWARESAYPTPVPEFFGTCPNDSATQIDGVLGVFLQADFETMLADEMRARNPVPQSISMSQGRAILIIKGRIAEVDAAIASMTGIEGELALSEFQYSQVIERHRPLTLQMQQILGLTDEEVDELFVEGAKL